MQQPCSNCGALLTAGAPFCGDCGAPVDTTRTRARATATLPGKPSQPTAAPIAARPRARRRVYYALGGLGALIALVLVVVVIVAVFIGAQPGGTAQQRVTTGPHITRIQTGTGFDQNKSLVLGETGSFSAGQIVFVVFTVVNQNPNAQIALKLFLGSTLELTSNLLNPNVGTSVYSDYAVVHQTGTHTWKVDYNGAAEASITFSVS